MKTKHFLITVICIALMFPFVMNAQSDNASTSKNQKQQADGWKPMKLNSGNGKVNVMNGVEFFHKRSVCKGDTVILIKAVNKNKFAVTIKWQESTTITKTITLAASTEVEGNCSFNDPESSESKLVIAKSSINKESKFNINKTLSVTEVK